MSILEMADKAELLSVVVPVYNGAPTIVELVEAIRAEPLGIAVEIILVNDGSADDSQAICEALVRASTIPMKLISHARNFGEHNAVMTGLRAARGDYILTIDDDLQNPPSEIGRLLNALRDRDLDVVYGVFREKQHARWRNLGSKLANYVGDWTSDKPRGLYMSTFRCMRRFIVDQIIKYVGPYPFIDGLIFQATNRVGSMDVEHLPNRTGRSNYTLRRLVSLTITILVNFSTRPLHISIGLGFAFAILGIFGAIFVIANYVINGPDVAGWPSLAVIMMIFTGVQLVMLGLMGEYIGRMFLHIGGRPQAIVRDVKVGGPDGWRVGHSEGGRSEPASSERQITR
jgi:glycosyltransferase involved in cell wall biosynthesis